MSEKRFCHADCNQASSKVLLLDRLCEGRTTPEPSRKWNRASMRNIHINNYTRDNFRII